MDVIASSSGRGRSEGRRYLGKSVMYILNGIGRLLKSR
jgi:hypothetical protein